MLLCKGVRVGASCVWSFVCETRVAVRVCETRVAVRVFDSLKSNSKRVTILESRITPITNSCHTHAQPHVTRTDKLLQLQQAFRVLLNRCYVSRLWVCCSVLQCVAVCCSVLQCVAVCRS